MPDYSQGKIYRIYSPSHLEVGQYIGSTTQPLSKRMVEHRAKYRGHQAGKNNFVSSFTILQYDDVRIELVEEYPCKNKEQLNRKEGEIIRCAENCVNRCIAGRTDTEYEEDHREEISARKKEYREAHKDEALARSKAYYEAHKEELSAKHKAYYEAHRDEVRAYAKEYRQRKKTEASAAFS